MQKVTENVFVETANRGCNTGFVVTAEGIVMVDTPMVPSEAKKWRDEIAKHGQLRYLINGEPHPDHISGNCYFDCTGIGHEGTRSAILSAKTEELVNSLKMMAPDSLPLDSEFHYKPPEITFSERLTFYLGSHTFHLLHLPGHTPYQVIVYVPEEKVIFTSDNVVVGIPFMHQSVPYEWLESLKTLQELDFDYIITGHGDVCPKSYISEMQDTIKFWINAVEQAIRKGISKEEAMDKTDLSAKYPMMSTDERARGIKRMNVSRLYDVLKK
ncbi:MAG: MBL fold metallo-hydrolase [Dehalococcoidales bacterium]|nr:MBL fold metallo-hydrolase [Dehalococcoidales bacterium]